MSSTSKGPAVLYRDGKPSAVLLDIEEYRELLERAEDAEDLRLLGEIRKQPLELKDLDEFLAEYDPGV